MNLNYDQNDDDGATIPTILDFSNVNGYSMDSSSTETQSISMGYSRHLINEIINNTLDDQQGTCELSSSQCSSLKCHSSEYSYDKRLEYWKNVLKEREKVSNKIQNQTKKLQSQILYNRLVTVDERDKFTVKSLMDYAQRLNPTSLSARQPSVLKEKCNAEKLALIPELRETLTQAEMRKTAQIEITGVPKEVQKELLGKTKWQDSKKRFSWLNSKYLENRIKEKRDDIERVIEYYPDIENLQIVGVSLLSIKDREHNSDIQIMSCNDICKISNDTHFEDDACEVSPNVHNNVVLAEYAFIINGVEYLNTNYRCNRNFETLTNFSCFPFETEVKKILIIQNVGQKVLDFEWVHRPFYAKNSTLLKCRDNEFVFDNMPFRLCSGESREIFVKFQPRRVNVVKIKWILKVKPLFFKRKTYGIVMSLCGACNVPEEYEQKLEEVQKEITEKSNMKMMKKLTTNLGTLAMDLIQSGCACPYQHSLNEMELFEQLNSGFKCERYNDLDLLKELYKRAKKPADEMWDLQVNTLKGIILKVPQAEERALLFNGLSAILNTMKGKSFDLEAKIFDNNKRYRSRFLYVRGIISTAIDEWVDLVSTLEETFYQTTLQVNNDELVMPNKEKRDLNHENKKEDTLSEEARKRQYIVGKRVRQLKPYRDAIYMQTYTLLCDFMENIVNVIESTI